MRVRVRFVSDQGAAPLRLEAGHTLASLQQAICEQVDRKLSEPLQISLNKKTVLSTDPEATLSQLGVCAGDVVWVLNAVGTTQAEPASTQVTAPAPPNATAASSTDGHDAKKAKSSVDEILGRNAPTATSTGAAAATGTALQHKPGDAAAASASQSGPSGKAAQGATGGQAPAVSEAMDVDEGEPGEPMEESPAVDATEPGLAGPSHLHHLLAQLGPMRPGPAPSVASEPPAAGRAEQSLQSITAPSTASRPPLQPAQQGQQQQGGGVGGGEDLEAAVAAALAGPLHTGPTAQDLLLLAAHAAMLEGGWQPASQAPMQLPATGVLKLQYQWVGQHAPHEGPVPASTSQPTEDRRGLMCSLGVLRMGRFLVIHGAPLVESSTRSTSSQQQIQQRKVSGVVLQFDAVQEVDQGVVMAAATSQQPLTTGVYRSLRSLWVRLRDGLALALCAACHQAAGLSPPVGLLALPLELKEAVLRNLEPRDLAALCCTCRELRYLAAEDFLWRPLFYRDFPRASVAERNEAELRGFKAAYAKRVLERRRAEAEARRRAQHRMLIPRPPPMPGGPFLPHMPAYPPNIIGGDYDRFPMMPGMPGTGGMMPGGGFFAGGMPGGLPGGLNPRGGGIHGPFGAGGPFSGGRRGGFSPWG